MNRNNIFGILIIGAIFIAWSLWLTPSKEEQAELRRINDSIAQVEYNNKLKRDSIALTRAQSPEIQTERVQTQVSKPKVGSGAIDIDKFGPFANSSVGEEEVISVETDLLKLKFTNKGGRVLSVELKDYKTFDGEPLILFDSDTTVFGISFFANNRLLNTQDFYYQASWSGNKIGSNVTISGDESVQLSLRLYTDADASIFNEDKYIEFLYTIKGNNYMLDYTINFHNVNDVVSSNTGFLNLEWKTDIRQQERSIDRWNGPTIYYKYANDDVEYMSETKNDDEQLKERVKWVSFKQHFFTSTLIAKDFFENADVQIVIDEEAQVRNPRYLKTMSTVVGLPYSFNPNQSVPMSFYFGPNKFNILKKYNLDLQRQIPLGWSFFLFQWINTGAVIPVFNFLEGFGWNYGIIILVLTLLLKLVLFPIAYKTYKSTAKMKVLKPEIDELAKKFPKKEDAMKKQQATMALYKKAGVNPMAGCVPMLLQMPILFAMFRFFPSSIELRQQSFLWATDLSSYDSIWTFPNGFSIPMYGDHISLFTLLMTVSTILYTRMNNQMMASNQQMPGMKTMMYMMPIMFLGIFNNYAAGLSYYYFLANIITFAQMYFIRRSIDENKILKQIELNKKKPVKKSNFQKKLEEAAKKRGYQTKK